MICSMNFEIQATEDFRKSLKMLAKRHRSLKEDFAEFVRTLKTNPFQGVELTPGIRKIRMAITSKGRGKSGGARIITFTLLASENCGTVYLIDIYDKAEQSTVDVAILKSLVDSIISTSSQ